MQVWKSFLEIGNLRRLLELSNVFILSLFLLKKSRFSIEKIISRFYLVLGESELLLFVLIFPGKLLKNERILIWKNFMN